LGTKEKKQWVHELCCKNKISFLLLQETKMEEMEDYVVRSLWGNMDFEFRHSPLVGNSGVWKPTGSKLLMIGVYAPQDLSEKRMLWNYLHGVLSRWQGETIVMGDFNEVRVPSERYDSVFNKHRASMFNSFINSSSLINVPLGLLCQFPAMTGLILTRHLSDHKPILLKEPIPFKMFLSWFDIEGFDQTVKDAWQNEVVVDLNEMSYLKKKFQMLKKKINSWVQQNRVKANDKRKEIQEKLHNLDKQKEQDGGQEYLLNPRKDLWKDLRVLDELTEKDLVQKAKVKRAIEDTWREWIKGCLVSSSALILVNESPTQEFDFEQGLRQGDTLSSFLFLLVMEALHISFVRAMDGGFFKGETNVEVNRGAQMIGCEASKTPFKYLGIMVGGKMNRIHSWDVVIDKVMARLSKWKVKTLFIGGRFTLTKSVQFFRGVEPGTRKVAWFSWDSVVASKDVGCLGVSTFFAMNCALLFKWIWRFKVQPEAMWVSAIKAIHGRLGNLDRGVKMVWNLEGDGVFKVSSARRFIDEGLCDMEGTHTRWIKLVPIKVNVFAWRLASNKLPTRFNMSSRGLEIPSMVASSIMAKYLGWWGVLDSGISSYQGWVTWFEGLRLRKEVKDYLKATFFVSWWFIWSYRNKLLFSSKIQAKASLFDLIVSQSFI
ncbi:RNA-directed DNA polymerase, eukaryota, partial [Tanacetum coccineum]